MIAAWSILIERPRSMKQAARNARRAHLVPRRFRLRAAATEPVQRAEVWRRGGGICYICSEPADPLAWHADHIIPLFKGGQHCYANLRVAHPRCNLVKADADPRDDGSPYAYLLADQHALADGGSTPQSVGSNVVRVTPDRPTPAQ